MNKKVYIISLEPNCKIFTSRSLLVKAMEALPMDAKILEAHFNLVDRGSGGEIRFESTLLPYENGSRLQLDVVEEVKLALRPYKY